MIHEKLRSVQMALKVPKNRFNKFGGYKYRNAEDILDAVKPLLADNGLTLKLEDSVIFDGIGGSYVRSQASLTDGETTIHSSGVAKDEAGKGMSASQGSGSASSYSKKYCLCNLFLIDDGIDDDLTNKHGKD